MKDIEGLLEKYRIKLDESRSKVKSQYLVYIHGIANHDENFHSEFDSKFRKKFREDDKNEIEIISIPFKWFSLMKGHKDNYKNVKSSNRRYKRPTLLTFNVTMLLQLLIYIYLTQNDIVNSDQFLTVSRVIDLVFIFIISLGFAFFSYLRNNLNNNIFHEYFFDVAWYLQNRDLVLDELDKTLSKLDRNSQISFITHSLGSVIGYDYLKREGYVTHIKRSKYQKYADLVDESDRYLKFEASNLDNKMYLTNELKETLGLKYNLTAFVAMGSPMGTFHQSSDSNYFPLVRDGFYYANHIVGSLLDKISSIFSNQGIFLAINDTFDAVTSFIPGEELNRNKQSYDVRLHPVPLFSHMMYWKSSLISKIYKNIHQLILWSKHNLPLISVFNQFSKKEFVSNDPVSIACNFFSKKVKENYDFFYIHNKSIWE